MKFHYKCIECGKEFEITPEFMVCDECSENQKHDEPLRGILEVVLDGNPGTEFDIFDFLPVDKEYFIDLPIGNSPLWKSENISKQTGFNNLYLKDDTRNLTFSYKDRASWLVAAFARKFGIKEIALASTGNAASSMAGVGAAYGLDITIFLPESAPPAKIVQSLQYGAKVIKVKGSYDDAFDQSLQYSKDNNVLSRNTAYNPMTIEGKKTASIEIFQQLGEAPDYVFVPTGDGVIIGGIYKGFKDLLHLGFIEKVPIIVAVQSEGSNAIAKAYDTGKFEPIQAKTVADSIYVGIPRAGYLALKNLKKYGGKFACVSDDEILQAQHDLSKLSGLFAEPAGAASYAGFLKMKDEIDKDAKVVFLITGSGLKDIDSARKGLKLG